MPENESANLLTFETERTGNVTFVRCRGRLVAGVSDVFYSNIHELIPGTKRIVLDLSDLTRMDSTGLGALVRVYVSARSAGCTLRLINLGKQVGELLATVNLLAVFTFIAGTSIRLA